LRKAVGGVVPDISNEKITGDTATVDLKGEAKTLTMPMVKEGGEWKLAVDKAFPNQRIFASPSPSGSPAGSPSQTPAEDTEGGDDPNGNEDK
jgi:hypothetical protein